MTNEGPGMENFFNMLDDEGKLRYEEILHDISLEMSKRLGDAFHVISKKVLEFHAENEVFAYLVTFIYAEDHEGNFELTILESDSKPIPTDKESLLFYAELVEIPFDKKRFN